MVTGFEIDMATSNRPLIDDRVHYLQKGVGSVEDAVLALTMDHDNVVAFAGDATAITDNFNFMATHSAAAAANGRCCVGKDSSENGSVCR